jgi:hypothetical protein
VFAVHLLAASAAFAQAPGLSGRQIEFGRDVHPVLQSRCASCHASAVRQGGLSIASADSLKQGGTNGPAIVPGNSSASLLVDRITGKKQPLMPLGGPPLSEREIAIIRQWIDAGANADTKAARAWVAPLKPRHVDPPEAGHPVDAFLREYWHKHDVRAPERVSDAVFVRRAYFDLHGLPPTPEQRTAFSVRPDRSRLIEMLLADRDRYAEHWISFWNDLLHNDEGVIYHGERKSISAWLLRALRDNMPYDRFVSKLINPEGTADPEGFILGVNWRGDINASQTPAMQAAQNSAQVFLGVNIKCASCHDSFVNEWKLKDAYGLASFFSSEPLEIVRCDARTGEMSSPSFLFPELGDVKGKNKLQTAALMFTHRDNGRLARTFVNRVWTRLIGRGIVENSDDMDAEPWSPDLLDWLASDFARSGFDVQHLLRRIMTSAAYQAVSVKAHETPYVFRGPEVRRLTAEQFADAVSAITGQWRTTLPTKPEPAKMVRDWRLKASPLARAMGRPVRDLAVTDRADDPSTLQALELINGTTLSTLLQRGGQYLAGDLRPSPEPLFDSGVRTSGSFYVDVDIRDTSELELLIADHDSYDPSRVVAGWGDAVLLGPKGTVRLVDIMKSGVTITPRNGPPLQAVTAKLDEMLHVPVDGFTKFRAAAGVDASSNISEINPRVRFLIYRNTPDPWRLLKVAGSAPASLPEAGRSPEALVNYLFEYAFSRLPTEKERAVALPLASDAAGIADLLWVVVLSPEFQFLM